MEALHALRRRSVQAGLGLLALLLAVAFWPRALPADLAPVERGPLVVSVDEEGETRVRDRFLISAPVAGQVQRIELEPGDPVRRGRTVVATFLPSSPAPLDARSRAEAEAAVAAAEAVLGRARAEKSRAEAALGLAVSERARHAELARQAIVARQALEAKEAEARAAEEALHAATFAVDTAGHQLEMARARLVQAAGGPGAGRALRLRSPIDGFVFRRFRESAAVVTAGEPLLELGDPRSLEIVSDLLSADAVKVRPGARVFVEHWGGERALEGRVRRVEPSGFMKVSALGVEEQRVNVVVDFVDPLEAQASLGDGYRVEVRIVVWQAEDVVVVPTSSLLRRGEDWAVFAVEGGRARLRRVEVGRRNGSLAQVVSGLAPGQKVIVHPGDALRDGSRVRSRS